MFKLCRERVALAGYRLANVIASIYKWKMVQWSWNLLSLTIYIINF